MKDIIVKSGMEIDLGKRGEHMARCVVFDISNWQKTYGEGSVHLLHQRNGDKAPYPCVVETDGPYVRWLLNETDVDVAGRGRAELQYFVDEARVKSETWNTRTNRSMNNEGPIPEEPAENWLNTMLQLGTETQENAEIAENSAEIAKRSAEMAKDSEEYVAGVVADVVAGALDEIQASVDTATESAEIAKTSSAEAQESAEAAEASSASASASEQAAKDAQTAAEQARDEAQNIIGEDFATKDYVDEKIAGIPTPDVSGQINEHNADTSAHADIRQRIDGLTAADVGAVSKAGDTMTGALSFVTAGALSTLINDGIELKLGNSKGGKYEELVLTDPTTNTLANLFQIARWDGASRTLYNILHTGNKPSGSYTGNGSATMRWVETGGTGSVIAIYCGWNGTSAIVTPQGALAKVGSANVSGFSSSVVSFENGVLTINTADGNFNNTNSIYYYQVL